LGKGQLAEEQLWQALQQEFGIRTVATDEHLLTGLLSSHSPKCRVCSNW